jgi:hypothetical protein
MKTRTWLTCCVLLLVTCPLLAAGTRTLEDSVPASDLKRVLLDAGVGDVEIATSSNDTIEIEVVLKPRRGGLFSSTKRGEREVAEAELEVEVVGHELLIQVETDADERRFEERWTIAMPAHLAFELDLGVGDVEIRGLTGGVYIEAGVGDVLVEAPSGDIEVELGVGDATVRAPAALYRVAEASAGVGNARLTAEGERVEGSGFVGHSASWKGSGKFDLEVEVGVGDAQITLR